MIRFTPGDIALFGALLLLLAAVWTGPLLADERTNGAEPVWRIDLNQASPDELTLVRGIGPARARQIVEQRSERPFGSHDDLFERVPIGPQYRASVVGETRFGPAAEGAR